MKLLHFTDIHQTTPGGQDRRARSQCEHRQGTGARHGAAFWCRGVVHHRRSAGL